ncbi:MAG: aminotransferase class V-fold PLP-dependent enzyme [Bacteroidia bacterium]|nr:aminotransferase class V-fold PLP-dependent enzyme [Bacteroidia bacterium]
MTLFSPDELEYLRAETPGTRQVIHLNHAGASLLSQPVRDTVVQYLDAEMLYGGYEVRARYDADYQAIYQHIANLIRCTPAEIALTESASHAWSLAFASLDFQPGDVILTARAEYVSNYMTLLRAVRKYGVEIQFIPPDETGQIDLEALARMLTPRVKLLALTHVPTSSGLVQPAAAAGQLARAAGVTYLLDACQSVGQLDVDVSALGCDILTATGRKFLRAPRGTGFLFVRQDFMERTDPPFPDGWSALWQGTGTYAHVPGAQRFEAFESSVASRMGLGAAVQHATTLGTHRIQAQIYAVAHRLRQQLRDITGITVHDPGAETCGIVTFTVGSHPAAAVQQYLGARRINVSVVFGRNALLDLEHRQLTELVRASVHYITTDSETDALCESLAALV